VSTAATTELHGAQLWVALPDASRHTAPAFEHYAPPAVVFGGATVRVFMGSLLGSVSPALAFTPLVGAQLDLAPFAEIDLPVDAAFEHGLLLDAGSLEVDGDEVPVSHLAYREPGASALRLVAGEEGARLLLIGGVPFGERIIMWWNFIGRTHEEVVGFRDEWMRDVVAGARADGRFGTVAGYDGRPLAAPELPGVRLRPRG
jgi:redox-sensitive bicupin YhaK (pirin superfamily)